MLRALNLCRSRSDVDSILELLEALYLSLECRMAMTQREEFEVEVLGKYPDLRAIVSAPINMVPDSQGGAPPMELRQGQRALPTTEEGVEKFCNFLDRVGTTKYFVDWGVFNRIFHFDNAEDLERKGRGDFQQ